MKKIKYILSSIFIVATVFISCETEIDEIQPDIKVENKTNYSARESTNSFLGRKLENPYSVTNMKIAFNNLNKRINNPIVISHYYVKFKPKNEAELDLIKRDTTLFLYEYPMDYKILGEVESYRDPLVPIGQPTYQYASVKVGYIFPKVDYEILENLFIPEEFEGKGIFNEELVDELVTEALKITNNLDEDEILQQRRGKWRPKGTLKLWDDNFVRYLPIEGVKVQARRWFRTSRGITNSKGYYSCNKKFRRKARYKIYWKRYQFVIRVGLFDRAKKIGPRKRGVWNWNIKNGRQEYYATIFKAAHHYYYKDIHGLRRPPQNNFWHTKLKIRARYKTNSAINGQHTPIYRFLGLGEPIKIFNPNRNSMEIYGTVIHEIAHASHWNMDRKNYLTMNYCKDTPFGLSCSGDVAVAESWARGVQWELTSMIYPSNIIGNYPQYFGDYTGVVQDMIDGTSGYDQVSGYTIRQIEDALNGEKKWNNWKTNIKNSYNNDTKENLESLFNYWN